MNGDSPFNFERLPDVLSLLPERDVSQFVERVAAGHQVTFKDVLERLRTHPASRIEELLPHRWQPQCAPA